MAAAAGTWAFSLPAVQRMRQQLLQGGLATASLQEAMADIEDDEETGSFVIGRGGYPNKDGIIQCDAAIMEGQPGRFGAVAALQGIGTPLAVARKVMEDAPHSFLVGDGAMNFAKDHGFTVEENRRMMSEQSTEAYQEYLEKGKSLKKHDTLDILDSGPCFVVHTQLMQGTNQPCWDFPVAPFELKCATKNPPNNLLICVLQKKIGSDGQGLIALDNYGNITVGVSTSGAPFKYPGRVGDSPLPGNGLYADKEVGAAAATGDGDKIMCFCPCFHAVLLMKQGLSPKVACQTVVQDILQRTGKESMFEIGIIAMNMKGEVGAASSMSFPYCTWSQGKDSVEQLIQQCHQL